MNSRNVALANRLRDKVKKKTEIVSDGEAVAMALLWGILVDHAECHGVDVEQLAREQLEAFILYARDNLRLVRPH